MSGPSHPSIPKPEHWVKAMRTTKSGEEVLGFVGYVASAEPTNGHLNVSVKGPAGLLEARPLPFLPPGVEHGETPEAFEFHWRILDYVFELPDPRAFAALTKPLNPAEEETVRRFVGNTRDLAGSTILNSLDDEVSVAIDDDTDEGHVTATFSRRDRQAGFAVLLRHCDSPKEPARFGRVVDVLWQANEQHNDAHTEARREILQQWRRAAGRLQQRSLDQLLRDKLAAEEDMKILDYREEHTPAYLMSTFNYGDLLHWDNRRRDTIADWETDDFEGPHTRMSFLAAAAALAHVYIGFAVLCDVALTRESLQSRETR